MDELFVMGMAVIAAVLVFAHIEEAVTETLDWWRERRRDHRSFGRS